MNTNIIVKVPEGMREVLVQIEGAVNPDHIHVDFRDDGPVAVWRPAEFFDNGAVVRIRHETRTATITWPELQYRLLHCDECHCNVRAPRADCECVCHGEES